MGDLAGALDVVTGAYAAPNEVRWMSQRVYDPLTQHVWAIESLGINGNQLASHDPQTDTAWEVHHPVGADVVSLLFDAARRRVLVVERNVIRSVDVDTHEITLAHTGWRRLLGAVIDETGETLYALELADEPSTNDRATIVSLTLATDARTEIHRFSTWTLPPSTEAVIPLVLDGDLLITSRFSHLLGGPGPHALDLSDNSESNWGELSDAQLCSRGALILLPNNLLSYGGGCLYDRLTGAEVTVLRSTPR